MERGRKKKEEKKEVSWYLEDFELEIKEGEGLGRIQDEGKDTHTDR